MKNFVKTHGCQMNEHDSAMLDVLKDTRLRVGIEEEIAVFIWPIREKAQGSHQLGRWQNLQSRPTWDRVVAALRARKVKPS